MLGIRMTRRGRVAAGALAVIAIACAFTGVRGLGAGISHVHLEVKRVGA